jgi:hypothetical protein
MRQYPGRKVQRGTTDPQEGWRRRERIENRERT